jgi:hypothetical protein
MDDDAGVAPRARDRLSERVGLRLSPAAGTEPQSFQPVSAFHHPSASHGADAQKDVVQNHMGFLIDGGTVARPTLHPVK